MEERRSKKRKHRIWSSLFIILMAIMILTLLIWRFYGQTMEKTGLQENDIGREFSRHYVMITDNATSSIWNDIYKSAVETGKKEDAYVEMLGDWFADDYTALDYMNIAISAKVDGIIINPDGSSKIRQAINRAEAEGIPVVTVLQDESQTDRTSFVGLNSYQLGMTYGNLVCDCITDETRSVLVLLNEKEAGKELVYKQLKETIQKSGRAPNISINSMSVTSQNTFDSEEVIHEIFMEEESRPDILVCMNEADSERAYQAMIEFNCVGDVQIIGYCQTDTMQQAIQKGIVPSAILLDANQIGVNCIEALEEYAQMGYVSNYFSVDMNIVTRNNIQDYMKEDEE